MANRPDFVVDSSGTARDARRQKYSGGAASTPPRDPETGHPEHGLGIRTSPQSGQVPRGVPGVIFIPIGLILTLAVALSRFVIGQVGDNNYSESEISSLNQGSIHFSNGEYETALVDFNSAIRSRPDFGEAYNGRGLVYNAMGNYEEALADFDRAIELLPDWAGSYSNRGIAYFALGEYDRAIADLDMAIQLEARFAKAYYNRGLVNHAMGNYDSAIADFDRAIEFTPEGSYPRLYNSTPGPGSELVEGLLEYMMLNQSAADLPLAYASRGVAYLNNGDIDRATADLEKAVALGLDPDDQPWVEELLEELRLPKAE